MMTKDQYDTLRARLLNDEINPTWRGYSTLEDMLAYFCDGEGSNDRFGSDVVMDRIMDIIEECIGDTDQETGQTP